jgi:serine/threonine protein phosphatase 1
MTRCRTTRRGQAEQRVPFAIVQPMIFRRRTSRHRPCAPDGHRVYAIGDVHGRLDLLTHLVARIDADDRARSPAAATTLVLLGDLVDRGPDSAGVIRFLRDLAISGRFDLRLIMGNHEELLLLATAGDAKAMRVLMRTGGEATLRSFGLHDEEIGQGSYGDLAQLLRDRLPTEDLDFLRRGENMIVLGDYAFVHAGIRPGVPLDAQVSEDLRWIRSEFLQSTRNHGKIVIHGHTPTADVAERPNRIGIDTGAYATGRLTAIGLSGEDRWFLATGEDA